MFIDLSEQTAIVTGGSSGIGKATAKLLRNCGANVAICGRDEKRLREAESELNAISGSGNFFARTCDVLNSDEVEAFTEAVTKEWGRVDMLINNAGQGRVSTFADTDDMAWRQELDLKFFGVIKPTRAFLPLLEKSKTASIVCVNSMLALQPEPHMVATSAARAGLLNLVHSLAIEFAPKHIRVNSILLGLVDSDQWRRRYEQENSNQTYEQWTTELAERKRIPLGRLGQPDEPAKAIVFLASPASSYTTGTSIDISGGLARHVS